jgi:plastocyanin
MACRAAGALRKDELVTRHPIRATRPDHTPATRPALRLPRSIRLIVFTGIAVFVGVAAVGLVVTRLLPGTATDVAAIQVSASMGGFEPPAMQAKAGSTVRVEFASTDTPFHSDGGGWHELAIEELGIDWKVAPQSRQVFEFTAPSEPGTYAFYCDICCGGKENPSMQGRLTVTA